MNQIEIILTTNTETKEVIDFLKAYNIWKDRLQEFKNQHGFNVTKLVQKYAPNKKITHFSKSYPDFMQKEVKRVKGNYNSGSYINNLESVLFFIGWIDIDFAIKRDLALQSIIINSKEIEVEKPSLGGGTFSELLETSIRDIYIPAQSENNKKYAYITIHNLINSKVLGMSTNKYALENNIEIDENKTIRDYLSKDKLEEIYNVEKYIWAFIFGANITDYEVLKQKVNEL